MIRKFKITYRAGQRLCTMETEATSKYDAKKRFYRMHPTFEIVKIEEVQSDV